MDYKSINGAQENLCIRVDKIYDWVTRQVDIGPLSFTGLSGLEALQFECNGATGLLEDPCDFLNGNNNNLVVTCFFTDEEGVPIDPLKPGTITCEEIGARQDVNVTLPSGQTITLQRVKVLIKGFVVVKISNAQGTLSCTSGPIEFTRVEKFTLCAPPGTTLVCDFSEADCDANLMCSNSTFQQLDISITLCANVQMEAKVKLEIVGEFCRPRQEIDFACPPLAFPPQCPAIFPPVLN